VEATPAVDWRWITDINLLGVVWGCQAAVPRMRVAGSGLVLNVASAAGGKCPGAAAHGELQARRDVGRTSDPRGSRTRRPAHRLAARVPACMAA